MPYFEWIFCWQDEINWRYIAISWVYLSFWVCSHCPPYHLAHLFKLHFLTLFLLVPIFLVYCLFFFILELWTIYLNFPSSRSIFSTLFFWSLCRSWSTFIFISLQEAKMQTCLVLESVKTSNFPFRQNASKNTVYRNCHYNTTSIGHCE